MIELLQILASFQGNWECQNEELQYEQKRKAVKKIINKKKDNTMGKKNHLNFKTTQKLSTED